MAREKKVEIEPPQLLTTVQKRRKQPALKSLPKSGTMELHRVWLPSRGRMTASTKRKEKGRALIVEAPLRFAGQITEPPGLRQLSPSASSLRKLDVEGKSKGVRPEHLAVSFKPKLIEKARPRKKIRKGRGLPTNIFTPDARFIYQDTSFPWSTVGRVDTSGGTCTGTMIGRRLLLTGSHCMQWTANGAGWVKFTPAYYNGATPFGVAWGTRVIYWLRADGSDGLTNKETAFDYVVIVLDRNLGDVVGYPGYRTYDSAWNGGGYWQHMGYPGDLSGGQRPAYVGPEAIQTVESESTSGQKGYVLGHYMDITPGHSGGPVWGWWGNEPWPRVVGVQSAEASRPARSKSGDNEYGGGPALSSLIGYARANFA